MCSRPPAPRTPGRPHYVIWALKPRGPGLTVWSGPPAPRALGSKAQHAPGLAASLLSSPTALSLPHTPATLASAGPRTGQVTLTPQGFYTCSCPCLGCFSPRRISLAGSLTSFRSWLKISLHQGPSLITYRKWQPLSPHLSLAPHPACVLLSTYHEGVLLIYLPICLFVYIQLFICFYLFLLIRISFLKAGLSVSFNAVYLAARTVLGMQ